MQYAGMQIHERLRAARVRAGFKTAAEAARRLGVPYGTYSGHESGARGIKRNDYETYAKFFGVSTAWLALGEEFQPSMAPSQVFMAVAWGEAGNSEDGKIAYTDKLFNEKSVEGRFNLDQKNNPDYDQSRPRIFTFPDVKHIVPRLHQSSEEYLPVLVNGPFLENIADMGSILYFSKSRIEKSARSFPLHVNKPCLLKADNGQHFVGMLRSNENNKDEYLFKNRKLSLAIDFERDEIYYCLCIYLPIVAYNLVRDLILQTERGLDNYGGER